MSEERYTIEGKIGRGGIGAVFRAYDNQLGRPVAIKRMLPPEESENLDPEDASSNLLKEAKVLSTLNHPNIVTVFDVGADSKGVFVVMELLNGETLDETISRGVLTEDDFNEVVIQTLEALIAAQDVDLVHRDIKPGNVMVVWLPSGKFQIKVLDFGLAKFSELPSAQTTDQSDAILGSIFFMAPEQFERGDLDGRTDLYALGCIYYHCLTGKYPFQGDTSAQVMASHLQNRMVPLEKYRPDLPQWLCNWVKWLLQRDKEERPTDAKVALEHFMAKSVGHAALQAEVEETSSAGVTVVGAPEPVSGTQVIVLAQPAAPPVMVAAPRTSGEVTTSLQMMAPETGAERTTGVVLPVQSEGNGKGKWIAMGISAALILAVGCFVLFGQMAKTKKENEFTALVDDDAPFGNALTVKKVLNYLDPKYDKTRRETAVQVLSKMNGDGVDEEILAQSSNYSGATLAALIRCMTVRRYAPAVSKMVESAAGSSSVDVQKAALNGVMLLGEPKHIQGLLGVLKNAKDDKVRDAAARTIMVLARSVEGDVERTAMLLRELDSSEPPLRKSLAAILGALGGEAVMKKFKEILDRGKSDLKYDVLAALMNWPDASASGMLQKLAEETDDDAVRVAAARAYVRLIGIPAPRTPGEEGEMLDVAWSLLDRPREKARLFSILADIPQDWASDYAGKFLQDATFKQMAKRTQETILKNVGDAQPFENGKPLKASTAKIGGTYEAAYSEKSDCVTNWRDPGTWVFWNFRLETPGTFTVKLEQANDDLPGSGYEVIVGENALEGKVENTRDWNRFIEVKLGKVDLPEPGIYTLTVKPKGRARTFIMNLRSVTLTKQ